MTDLFKDKAADWDGREMSQRISIGVGDALQRQVRLRQEMQVMDFGAGTGLVSGQLAPRVARVVAVDVSPAMLARLAEKAELKDRVETVCQDILAYPLDRTFDLIVSAMALHHVDDTDRLLQRFAEHLKPGGEIALADLDAEDGSFHPAGTPGIYHHGFDREMLRGLLQVRGFVDITFSTALEISRDGRNYPIFLVSARRPPIERELLEAGVKKGRTGRQGTGECRFQGAE